MAVPTNLARVTMHGRLGGSEVALFGFHLRVGTESALTEPQMQQVADRIRDAWMQALGTKKDLFSGAYQLEYVRLDWLNPAGGPQHLKTRAVTNSALDVSGTNSFIGTGASLPWECALCISLAAYPQGGFAPNKGRHRGRFYLPALPASIISGTEAQLPDSATAAYATAMVNFLELVNDQVGGGLTAQMRVVVLSRVDDAAYDVQHIWVDSKVDSQRRRENRQPAAKRLYAPIDS